MRDSGELEELLTLEEAGKILKCHKNTLRLWDKKGILKAIRIGDRGLRYRKSDIQKLIENGPTSPKVESADLERQRIYDLFRQAPIPIAILRGPDHVYEFSNPLTNKVLKVEDPLGKSIKELFPDNKEIIKLLDTVYKTGKPFDAKEYPINIETSDNRTQTIYVNATYQPLFDKNNNVEGIMTTGVEVTEQVLARRKIEESELRYRTLVDANIVGVIMADLNGFILDANDSFLYMLGLTKQDLQKNKLRWDTLTPPEFQGIDAQIGKELRESYKSEPKEKAFFHKNGTQIPVMVACAIVDERKGIAIALVLDISERKILERQKDEFLGIASHELKTPVTSIKAYAQVLYKLFNRKGDIRSADMVGKMDAQINKLTVLISDLLDVTKIQSGKLQFNFNYFDFNELVLEVVEEVQRTTVKHKIRSQLTKSKTVYGDRERTGQVITNYLTNAIKYSPDSESIIVKTTIENGNIILSVQDFGLGIPEANKDKVFERFYRVQGENKETYPGLGLGLYISREIIDRQKGRVWVESQEKKGATFYFSLPIQQQK